MSAASPRLRVLVVDDEELLLRAFRRCFRHDFEMTFATDVAQALVLLETNPFDVLLADYAMPVANGVSLLKRAAALHPAVVRLLVTAHYELPEVKDALLQGVAAAAVSKPWTRDSLLSTVAKMPGVGGAPVTP